ncbi:eukaryotic translation initiation factor 5B-like [Apostichopus japonicus]|uniref:eukaryotic translation initiation factor 5B-like n=1 Tax=Stichopus japonicus TaxID=307972 RepID=UPI003AB318DA
MGKPKKAKKVKSADDDAFGDDILQEIESMENGSVGQKKENDNPVKQDGEAAMEEEEKKPEGGKKSKKKKNKNDWDVDALADEVEAIKVEGSGGSPAAGGESQTGTPVPSESTTAVPKDDTEAESSGKKNKKKKKKKDKFNEDDLLKEVEGSDVGKPPTAVSTTEVPAEDSKAVHTEKPKPVESKETGEQEGGMKTAAQKKAEKKEREKKKKEQERLLRKQKEEKTKKQEGTKEEEKGKEGEDEETKAEQTTTLEGGKEGREVEGGEAEEGEEDDSQKKKKKKKKKAKKGADEEEEEKEKKRKPGKSQLKAMQEALKQAQEEEARLKAEEEAKIKAFEEAEANRLEKVRLDKERREKRKQKEKEKIERQKAEGTYLTKAQKEAKRIAEEKLAALKQQGIIVPERSDGSKPTQKVRYVTKPRKKVINKVPKTDTEEQTPAEGVKDVVKEEGPEVVETTDEVSGDTAPATEDGSEDGIKDSWDADEEEEDDVKDNWDDEEEEKEEETEDIAEPPKVKKVTKKKPPPSKDAVDEESDSEEDESSGEEDEDEEEESESETESESGSESESEDDKTSHEDSRQRAVTRMKKRRAENEANIDYGNLRCPVICVLGHVDTGKTKILDKIRHTNVQDGEAGGITQQIGATMVPESAIREQTKMCRQFSKADMNIKGLLIIDTPGHESFSNLRSRGSSLCDFAILVVDIMHGLEPQTIESINLLKQRKTPFVVALNKIDRLYEWKASPHSEIQNALKKQKKNTKDEFDEKTKVVITEFAEQSLNAALFWENPDPRTYISLVPTSAHSGDGMGNLIALIIELSQSMLQKRLAYSQELTCTSMEVKTLPGLGTTMDVVLVNGKLQEGATLVVAGQEGPIVTQIRGLLTTQPLKELRVKNQYIKHKEIYGAQGLKILAKDLEKALAGLPVLVAEHPDEVEILKDEVEEMLTNALQSIKLAERGVYVQASTLGSLEALLEFLKTSKIPYAGINIGPVHRKDVMKASVMLEHDSQYAVILAFDVKVERDAQEMADKEGIKVFQADIIYHLFDSFTRYREELKAKRRDEFKHIAIFPCKLRVIPQFIFNARNPIVVGVQVEAGIVKEGTPIIVPSKENLEIGVVSSVEANHKQVESARKGQEVCVKIENVGGDAPKMYGRHFDANDMLVSKISRESIDAVKEYFREDLEKSDWQLMIELKNILQII